MKAILFVHWSRVHARWFSVLALLGLWCPQFTLAGQSDGFDYEVTTNGAITITGYTGAGGRVTIPETIEGLPVASIGARAFYGCATLNEVVVAASVTNLGSYAFASCVWLTNVVLSTNLPELPSFAFASCSNLTRVTMGEGLTRVGHWAFRACDALERITFPKSLDTVDASAFNACNSLGDFFFEGDAPTLLYGPIYPTPYRAVRVYHHAKANGWDSTFGSITTAIWEPDLPFAYNPAGTNACSIDRYLGANGTVVIPDAIQNLAVTSIGASAFTFAGDIYSVTVPASVTTLGTAAFALCGTLTNALFLGNAPTADKYSTFAYSTNTIVYYYEGASGWDTTFALRPTVKLFRQTAFEQWAATNGLAAQFPNACGEPDDADHDGMSNLQEMYAGTDPTSAKSALAFESTARPEDLIEEDKTPLEAGQFALYFQTVPGRTYDIQSCATLNGEWSMAKTVIAATTQKRVALSRPAEKAFYRVATRP
jgi:hypothetical protein